MAPLLEGMRLEGFYGMKDPCYQSSLVNVPTPQCLKGSPWVEERALYNLVGTLSDPNVTLSSNDNFHRADTIYPYHHPDIDHSCADTTGPCTVSHISNSQNMYDVLNELDLGKTPIAARECRVKLKSSQSVHWAAREPDADFEALDDKFTECESINMEVMDWAMANAHTTALQNYDTYGEKLVMGGDHNAINGGTWIYAPLQYNKQDDGTMQIVSIVLPLPDTEIVDIFKSMHYCKMISPFRALEWIYVDSQYEQGGYAPQEAAEVKFLTQ